MFEEINRVFHEKNNLYNHIYIDVPYGTMESEKCPNPYWYNITFSDREWSVYPVECDDGEMLYILSEFGDYNYLPVAEGQNYGDQYCYRIIGETYTYLLNNDNNEWLVLKNSKEV